MKAFRTQSSRLWIFKRLVVAIILVTVLGLGDKWQKYMCEEMETWVCDIKMC